MSEEFKNFDELFRAETDETSAERNARVRREAHERRSKKATGDRARAKDSAADAEGSRRATGADSARAAKRAAASSAAAKPSAATGTGARAAKTETGASKSAAASAASAKRAAHTTDASAQTARAQKTASKSAAKTEREQTKAKKRAKEEPVPENWTPSEAPIRPRRDGRSGCLGGLVFFAFVLSLSIILACVGWMAASDVLALNKDPITATVTLDKARFDIREERVTQADGTSKTEEVRYADIDYVASVLKDAGIIEYKGLFKTYCKFTHASTQIAPGTYELSTNFDYRALVKKMQVGTGAMVTTKVTIPEGFSMEQIFRRLEEEGICSYEDLMDAAANYQYNYSFLDDSQMGDARRLEGYLFPDTYEFYQGMQASSAINKFLVNFHDRLTKEMLDLSAERGLTLQQTITIASMIEKEAANDDERALIASVIYNRMRQNMPLQIDSTIMYVLEEHGDVLTQEQTQIDSPYNTYTNTGLPPTPIASPGLASINAALRPAENNYLFYALNAETGEHQFFTSYGEFQAFVAQQGYSQ